MTRTMRRTSQLLGGAAVTTALLLSTLSGTANAAVGGVILVQQLNSSLGLVCTQNYVGKLASETIHDPTCADAAYAAITSTATLHPITVHTDYVTYTFNGLYVTPLGPHGLDIDAPGGVG
jgi:hypothetical protein